MRWQLWYCATPSYVMYIKFCHVMSHDVIQDMYICCSHVMSCDCHYAYVPAFRYSPVTSVIATFCWEVFVTFSLAVKRLFHLPGGRRRRRRRKRRRRRRRRRKRRRRRRPEDTVSGEPEHILSPSPFLILLPEAASVCPCCCTASGQLHSRMCTKEQQLLNLIISNHARGLPFSGLCLVIILPVLGKVLPWIQNGTLLDWTGDHIALLSLQRW